MIRLFLAEFRRNLIDFIRYPAEVLVAVVILVVLFYGLFLGTSYIAGPQAEFGARLDAIIVGYVVWTMALHSLASVASELQKEAQIGALQQVFLSTYGPTRVFVSRTVADILLTLLITLTILFAILLLTGRTLKFSPQALLPVITIIMGSFGLAFLMGAMALRFKRVQQLMNLGQFVLLFLMVIPFETWEGPVAAVQYLLPMASGTGVLRQVMVNGAALDWNAIGFAFLNGAIYALAGLWVFSATTRSVRRSGTLGWY